MAGSLCLSQDPTRCPRKTTPCCTLSECGLTFNRGASSQAPVHPQDTPHEIGRKAGKRTTGLVLTSLLKMNVAQFSSTVALCARNSKRHRQTKRRARYSTKPNGAPENFSKGSLDSTHNAQVLETLLGVPSRHPLRRSYAGA